MRVLVACEFSGAVRQAFRDRGHDAWSCDLLPAEDGSPFHYQGDVLGRLGDGWDVMIAHPPCTHLAVSGARWFREKKAEQAEALAFVKALSEAPIHCIAIENPVSILSSRWRRPDQIIQPWQFGHGETKATCLWLQNLPPLLPTDIVDGRTARVHLASPGPDRWKERSRTLNGIAQAMADQWGNTKPRCAAPQHHSLERAARTMQTIVTTLCVKVPVGIDTMARLAEITEIMRKAAEQIEGAQPVKFEMNAAAKVPLLTQTVESDTTTVQPAPRRRGPNRAKLPTVSQSNGSAAPHLSNVTADGSPKDTSKPGTETTQPAWKVQAGNDPKAEMPGFLNRGADANKNAGKAA